LAHAAAFPKAVFYLFERGIERAKDWLKLFQTEYGKTVCPEMVSGQNIAQENPYKYKNITLYGTSPRAKCFGAGVSWP